MLANRGATTCKFTVDFGDERSSFYDTLDDLLADVSPTQAAKVQSMSINFEDLSRLNFDVTIMRALRKSSFGPAIHVRGDDRTTVEGARSLLLKLFDGQQKARQRFHVPGEVPWPKRFQSRAAVIGFGLIGTALGVAVTILVTKLLS